MRILTALAFTFVATSMAMAQKVDVDDDIMTIDGQPICKLEKVRGGGDWDFKVLTLEGKALIHLNGRDYIDESQISQANKTGRVFYYEWTFLESNAKAETNGLTQKMLAKKLNQARLIKDGAIDPDAEKAFVSIEGMPHSDRKRQLDLPVIIIQR